MRGINFGFDYVHFYCKCHKINLNRRGSYMDSPDWLKNKKATINPINKKDNQCFQYAVTVTLNYEKIKIDPQRIKKVKPFINKYNWERIHFSSEKDDWKKLEKNNVTIAFNVLYAKKEKIYPAYVSKHNSNREKRSYSLKVGLSPFKKKNCFVCLIESPLKWWKMLFISL